MKLITSYTLEDCLAYLGQHREKQAWSIIGVGLHLIKARALHARPANDRGQGRKSSATVDLIGKSSATVDLIGENPGFEQWLTDYVCSPDAGFSLSRSSAYNYMRAATNLGLTAEDDDASLLALQEARALEGKRLRDLYKPVLAEGAKEPPRVAPPLDPIDYWDGFKRSLVEQFADESKNVIALYQLPRAEVDMIETQLRAALDTVRQVKADLAAGKSKSK